MINQSIVRQALVSFEEADHEKDLAGAEEQRAECLRLYPTGAWPHMPLERYALGQPGNPETPETFCRRMEFLTPDLGSIKGGTSRKCLIYLSSATNDWWYDTKRFDSADEAWQAIRSGFAQAIHLAEANDWAGIERIDALKSGPALLNKTLALYFPDRLLPVNSQTHLRHFLRELGHPDADDMELGTIRLNRLLFEGLRSVDEIADWSTKKLERLLYTTELDPFPAVQPGKAITDVAGFIAKAMEEMPAIRLETRQRGLDEAARLLDASAGAMTEEQARQLFTLFNTDWSRGKEYKTRFSPGFVGSVANMLVSDLGRFNERTAGIWRADDPVRAAGALLDDRSLLPGAGSSFPSMLAHVKDPANAPIWLQSMDTGLRRLASYVPARTATSGGLQDYLKYRDACLSLMDLYEIPAHALDWILSEASRVTAAPKPEEPGPSDPPRDTETPTALLPAVAASTADSVYLPVTMLQEIVDLLSEKRQVILHGPPGTGKTYVALALAESLVPDETHVRMVQFHPSYSYEDFVGGFRPKEDDSAHGVTYTRVDGPLRELAKAAEQDPGNPYVLIIDEINRGNIPKIFGELLFLLEYRNRAVQLQYWPEEDFSLPENLFVIGTMNTSDRSIALIDMALRRRFYFVPFDPRVEPVSKVLPTWLERHDHDKQSAALLTLLNEALHEHELAIGPSYFMTNPADGPDVERVWQRAIMPLLDEFFYGMNVDRQAFSLQALQSKLAPQEPPSDAA